MSLPLTCRASSGVKCGAPCKGRTIAQIAQKFTRNALNSGPYHSLSVAGCPDHTSAPVHALRSVRLTVVSSDAAGRTRGAD